MKIFYFTATGNSLSVAKHIGGELISMVQVLKGDQREFIDEKIGFVFPVYGGSIPTVVEDFIKFVLIQSGLCFCCINLWKYCNRRILIFL